MNPYRKTGATKILSHTQLTQTQTDSLELIDPSRKSILVFAWASAFAYEWKTLMCVKAPID